MMNVISHSILWRKWIHRFQNSVWSHSKQTGVSKKRSDTIVTKSQIQANAAQYLGNKFKAMICRKIQGGLTSPSPGLVVQTSRGALTTLYRGFLTYYISTKLHMAGQNYFSISHPKFQRHCSPNKVSKFDNFAYFPLVSFKKVCFYVLVSAICETSTFNILIWPRCCVVSVIQ